MAEELYRVVFHVTAQGMSGDAEYTVNAHDSMSALRIAERRAHRDYIPTADAPAEVYRGEVLVAEVL